MSTDVVHEASRIVEGLVARSKPLLKAALLLNSLSPELTVEVSRGLTEREIKRLLPELRHLPSSSVASIAVVSEFFSQHRLWTAVGGPLHDAAQIIDALERWAARNPRRLARLLKESWLATAP